MVSEPTDCEFKIRRNNLVLKCARHKMCADQGGVLRIIFAPSTNVLWFW